LRRSGCGNQRTNVFFHGFAILAEIAANNQNG